MIYAKALLRSAVIYSICDMWINLDNMCHFHTWLKQIRQPVVPCGQDYHRHRGKTATIVENKRSLPILHIILPGSSQPWRWLFLRCWHLCPSLFNCRGFALFGLYNGIEEVSHAPLHPRPARFWYPKYYQKPMSLRPPQTGHLGEK